MFEEHCLWSLETFWKANVKVFDVLFTKIEYKEDLDKV